MLKIKHYYILFLVFIYLFFFSLPVQATNSYLPTDPIPKYNSPIILTEKSLILDWLEKTTHFSGTYSFENPTEKDISLIMYIQLPPGLLENDTQDIQMPLLQVWQNDETIKVHTYKKYRKHQGYSWEVEFPAHENITLKIDYSLANLFTENNLVQTGYIFRNDQWTNDKTTTMLQLRFNEIHPGLITEKLPKNHTVKNNNFVWTWNKEETPKDILFTADIHAEQGIWRNLLTAKDNIVLDALVENNEYSLAADFLKRKYDYSSTDNINALNLGQAYYYEKAGELNESAKLWKTLFDDETSYKRVYWSLGNIYQGNNNYLEDIYEQVRDLHIHPLIQSWLAAQINDKNIKPSKPEFSTTNAIFEEDGKGLIIKTDISDIDGDIEKITLNYHWEDETDKEKVFDLPPYEYIHKLNYFIAAAKPLQRLYFEISAVDEDENITTTGIKEAFYLNSKIPSETFNLLGANLVLGDFSTKEQDKVFKWFQSYLKMAKEAKFIPLEAHKPYLIFLGKSHDFITKYNGPHFIQYTPYPFTPDNTVIPVHRYFLSYLYGPGWQNITEDEFKTVADALLLGKGSQVLDLKYLQHKDNTQFYKLLQSVGEGNTWNEALVKVYNMSPNEIKARALWFTYGNFVIAFILIIFIAWIGKKGYVLSYMQHRKKNKS